VGISLVLIVAGLILSARGRHEHHATVGAWVVLPILLASGTSVCNSFNYVLQKKLLHDLPKADINLVQNVVSLLLFSFITSGRRGQASAPTTPRNGIPGGTWGSRLFRAYWSSP
jgi:hypothetical protein